MQASVTDESTPSRSQMVMMCRGRRRPMRFINLSSAESAHVRDGEAVHVVERLVLSCHGPYKAVASRTDAGVDGPARGDDRLAVTDHEMSALGRLNHAVDGAGVVGQGGVGGALCLG